MVRVLEQERRGMDHEEDRGEEHAVRRTVVREVEAVGPATPEVDVVPAKSYGRGGLSAMNPS